MTAPKTITLIALFLLSACSGRAETPGAAAPGHGAAAPAGGSDPGAPEIPWGKKNRTQKLEYMGIFVYPKMKGLFQGYSAEEFKSFKCQTCHGQDMEKVDFRMPNALYSLSAENTITEATSYDPKKTEFMQTKVLPTMAELLGMKHNPTTNRDFGCFNCHPKE